MKMILTDNGWINAKNLSASQTSDTFKPDRVLSSHEWEADVKKMKQKVIDKRNENNKFVSKDKQEPQFLSNFKDNVVKIIDKSYIFRKIICGW